MKYLILGLLIASGVDAKKPVQQVTAQKLNKEEDKIDTDHMNFTELKLVLDEANRQDAVLDPKAPVKKIPTAASLSQMEKA